MEEMKTLDDSGMNILEIQEFNKASNKLMRNVWFKKIEVVIKTRKDQLYILSLKKDL